ncbi:hypothetical protein [Planctomyces sp. SH-PL14]|uniref:hypothetical protein n=1 Tax=Planctomyces sp. SH-PL14 TaxID=1632864 RepID=UPI0012E7127B|nr:hypothetical protein [Planctomyces sp. SH-PL14]
MKVPKTKEIEIAAIRLTVPVRDDDETAEDFPGRKGNQVTLVVGVDDGVIQAWPSGLEAEETWKACDSGVYELIDPAGAVVKTIEDYVPDFIPNSYGDYVELKVSGKGVWEGWKSSIRELKNVFTGDME